MFVANLRSERALLGLTLIEVLIAASLLLLALSLLTTLVVPSIRYSADGLTQIDLQRSADSLRRHLTRDLLESVPAGVSFAGNAEQTRVAIHPLGEISASGQQVWKDEIILFGWDAEEARLRRSLWTQGTGQFPVPGLLVRAQTFTFGDLESLWSDQTRFDRIMAENLVGFELNWHGENPQSLPLRVRLVFLTPRGLTSEYSFERYLPQSL